MGEMRCEHHNFAGKVSVYRLTRGDDGPVTGYTADVTIRCADCNLPFRFLGMQAGSHPSEPRVSVDGQELRAPLEPAYVTEILGHPIVSGRA